MKKNTFIRTAHKIILFFSCLLIQNIIAQPDLRWQKCYGGTTTDAGYSTSKTNDGGYVMIGETNCSNGNVIGFHGGLYNDIWVVKTDSSGNFQWQKCLGGTNNDLGLSIVQTSDSGYIVAGGSVSNDGDVIGNHGSYDYWVVKLDVSGTVKWQKCLGGTGNDIAESILQTADGGYIVAGSSASIDGDVSGNHGNWDIWMVKLDTAGSIQWQKSLGKFSGIINSKKNRTLVRFFYCHTEPVEV